MPARRHFLPTARLVLAWFVAFLFVAGIAPMMEADAADALCTPVVAKDGKALPHQAHKLECSLCAGVAAPPTAMAVLLPSAAPLGHALLPHVAAHLAGITGAPLPARGPPALS
jgi:hypothetical protein